MLRKIVSFLLIMVQYGIAFGQTQSGSLYGAYGIGVPQNNHFGAIEALGGTGIGLRLPYGLNTKNPAGQTSIAAPFTMLMSMGIQSSYTRTVDQQDQAYSFDGGLTNLDMWFRFSPNWTTSIGLTPFTNAKYAILTDRFFQPDGSNYQVENRGEGGVTQVRLSQAWAIFKQLHIGLTGSLYFGNISRSENVTGISSSGDFNVAYKTVFTDTNLELGIQYVIPTKSGGFTIGSTFQPKANLASDEDYLLTTNTESLEGSIEETEDYSIPMRLGTGISFQSKKWTFAVDASYEKWSDLKEQPEKSVRYHDVLAFSAGAEYALLRPYSKSALEATRFRAGFGIRNSYLNLDEQDFRVWQFSFGVGLPISKLQNQLNLTYRYNHQGRASESLVRDVTHSLTFHFDLRDIWFVKRKYR